MGAALSMNRWSAKARIEWLAELRRHGTAALRHHWTPVGSGAANLQSCPILLQRQRGTTNVGGGVDAWQRTGLCR
jgi:hypothetical protein